MKQLKQASIIFISASLLPSLTLAHNLSKDEASLPYHWTGIYAGLSAGAVKHTMSVTDNQASTFNATIQQVLNPRFTGGFQIGYRKQLDTLQSSGVFGLEFNTNFSDARFKQGYGSPFALYQLKSTNTLHSLPMLQFIGGIAADRTLLFIGAGMAWTHFTGSITNTDGVPFFNSFAVDKKELGAVASGGIEYAFSDKISARLKIDVIYTNAYSTFDNAGNSYQISNDIIQGTFGVNYKFG